MEAASAKRLDTGIGRMSNRASSGRSIVGSAHLVSERSSELSEFEFGLMVCSHAFERWITRGMAAAGISDLGPLDVMVLHSVNHRGREKRLADLCLVLNMEDSHVVSYSLKKLVKHGLVSTARRGKETVYAITKAGATACSNYRSVREDCLIDSLGQLGGNHAGLPEINRRIGELADLLRALSGLYDQAARSAASL